MTKQLDPTSPTHLADAAYSCARGVRQRNLVFALLDEVGMLPHVPTAMGVSKSQQRQPGRCASAWQSWDGLTARLGAAGLCIVERPTGPRDGTRLHLTTLQERYPHLTADHVAVYRALRPEWTGTDDDLVKTLPALAY